MAKVPVHRPESIFPYSMEFVKNAARFTATEGLALGDFYKLNLPTHNIYVITDPALVREVMVRKESHYEKSKIYWKQLLKVIGPALGSLEGEEWKFLRQLHSPYFSNTTLKDYLPVARTILHKNLDQQKEVFETELVSFLAGINTGILLKQVFGIHSGSETEKIGRYIGDGQKTITWRSKYPWRPFLANLTGANKRIARHLRFFDRFTTKAVNLRHVARDESPEVLLDALMRHHATDKGLDKNALKRIRNEFIVYLGAGTETMAVSEAYTLHLLWQHPDVLKQVEEEISSACGNAKISEEHLPQLQLTTAVVLESMRLQPSSYALLRDCIKEDELNGQRIKPGDSIFISIYATHRNPRLWHDPLKFDPSRFLEPQEVGQNDYRYMPYGAGKHQCIGRYLATPQMALSIAAVVQRFELNFITKELEIASLSTLKPKDGIHVKLVPKAILPD